jgi:hypothetical protein
MQNWNLTPEHPITLTIAADARLGPTDYLNDQIWELKVGSSDPPSISFETTFGLRARLCRIFPHFIFKDKVVTDPVEFSHPITIHRYYPNYIELSFKPFSHINVKLEYWVPSSHVSAGRIRIKNTSHEEQAIQLEWAELLLSSADGFRMTVNEIGVTTLLAGRTSNISPVLFLTGGAQAGKSPYPSLNLSYTIAVREEKEAHWVHASLEDMNSSYSVAKEVSNKNWDAEFARIARVNSRSLEIHTGNKDWDSAFLLSQNIALQLFLHPTQVGKPLSFVTTRQPDQGFSLLGDGSDYNYLWNGQSPLDSLYLINLLLPSSPELLKYLLDNFLDSQTDLGEIDWKPGLAGQRSHLLATPVLANILLQLFDSTRDNDYCKIVFPKLLAFFLSWFSHSHDRDEDQIPEWDQPIQTGFEDFPLFSQHHSWSFGVDITSVESPDLSSYLYRECISLIKIAKEINEIEMISKLETLAEKLKAMVEQTWSDQDACYHYRDRETHTSFPGEILGTRQGVGAIEIHKEFIQPIRPVIRLESKKEITHPCQFFIHGKGITGLHRIEHIPEYRIHWQHQYGFITSDFNYLSIERIEINGIRPEDSVIAQSINYRQIDQSLVLPLWAGIPAKDRAKILINLTIMNKKKLLGPYGLRTCVDFPEISESTDEIYGIHLPWTALLLDGLVQYEERNKAAEIFQRLMKPVISSLQHDMTLHQSYHIETGKTLGVQNSITSLLPIGLFLKILGVKIITPFKIELAGHNPFPWPVTVKYQGLTIIKQENKSFIIFPDGHNITVNNDQHQTITREKLTRPGTN